MGRKPRHTGDELRSIIIDAAREMIERDGIGSPSARQIASRIDYSAGTIYNQFRSIDDILLEIQQGLLRDALALLQGIPPAADPSVYLDELAQAYVRFAIQNQKLWNLLFTHVPSNQSHNAGMLYGDINALSSLVENAVRSLMPERTSDEELSETARALWAGLHGITAIAVTRKAPMLTTDSAANFARRLTATYIAGLASPRPKT